MTTLVIKVFLKLKFNCSVFILGQDKNILEYYAYLLKVNYQYHQIKSVKFMYKMDRYTVRGSNCAA